MNVEVIYEYGYVGSGGYKELCPRCKTLRPIVERVTNVLNIPFIPKLVGLSKQTENVYGKDSTSLVFNRDFLQRNFKDLAENPLAVNIVEELGRFSHFPNLVIRFDKNGRKGEIVIRGFPTSESRETRLFELALFRLLSYLKEV